MKTVRRLLYRPIINAVLLTTAAFLALFFFFDSVEELQDVGKNGLTTQSAFLSSGLMLPRRLYEVFPITLLIGAIVALSRLAQTSEFTILRTGGLGPVRALGMLAMLGILAAILMAFIGNLLVPWAEQWTAVQKANMRQDSGLPLQTGGVWLRDKISHSELLSGQDTSPLTITVNVGGATDESQLRHVRIFINNSKGQLLRKISAREANIEADGNSKTSVWHLYQVTQLQWANNENNLTDKQVINIKHSEQLQWKSQLSKQVIAAAVLPIESMSLLSLWRYSQHLSNNAQASQKYELHLWKKAFAPLACLVMIALALPFAYLQARQGGITMKIFGGVMLGISFVLANHVSGHLGLLHQWKPWLAASVPSLLYTIMAMAAFSWLVKNR